MTRPDESKREELATCHAIIGHPHKPSFLAIRHAQGWSPPTVRFPPGPVDYRAAMINEGMQKKYGLDTRVLRVLFTSKRYHCVEMELTGPGARRLDAVWVDRAQYERFRTPPEGQPDPFEKWLGEREQNLRPALRPPWEYPGWFDAAAHWIQFQLDALQKQVTGSVEQYRVGWNASCLLRVPTSEGQIYFKASYARPPLEAALTAALAKQWPQWVIAPLAVDTGRNWMLNEDFRAHGPAPKQPAELVPFARALAGLQVASSADLATWRALGCPVHDLAYLDGFTQRAEHLTGWLQAGGGRLTAEEIARLGPALQWYRPLIGRLADFGLPNALVHADFRPDNLAQRATGPAIIDWSDCVISQPFFVLDRLLGSGDERGVVRGRVSGQPLHAEDAVPVRAAYLEPFAGHAGARQPAEILELARRLFPLWRFTRIAGDLAWLEPESVDYQKLAVWLQTLARKLIRIAARERVPAG